MTRLDHTDFVLALAVHDFGERIVDTRDCVRDQFEGPLPNRRPETDCTGPSAFG